MLERILLGVLGALLLVTAIGKFSTLGAVLCIYLYEHDQFSQVCQTRIAQTQVGGCQKVRANSNCLGEALLQPLLDGKHHQKT